MANAIQAIEKSLIKIEPQFTQIARANGGYVEFITEMRYAMQIIRRSSALSRAVPETIIDAVTNIAAVGLSLNPVLQHAALIPRVSRKDANKVYCHFDPMYRGLIKLATDGGIVKLVQADAVYEEEYNTGNFKMIEGTQPTIFHNRNPLDQKKDLGKIVGAYCVAWFKDSPQPHTRWITRDEIDAIAARSESFNPRDAKKKPSGPWVTDFQEMCVKSVIKRARKQWPIGSERLDRAIALSNMAEDYVDPDGGDDRTINGTAIEVVSKDQAAELRALCKRADMKVNRVYEFYSVKSMELLPRDKFTECKQKCLLAIANHELKKAAKGTVLYADDYGLTLKQFTDAAANFNSKATLKEHR
jgi:recombination protein RecT